MTHLVMPQTVIGRNAKTLDSGTLKIRVEYPDTLESYGRDRILSVLAAAMRELQEIAETCDPASPGFECPPTK